MFDNDDRPGCLMGLLQLFLLDKLFDWLQGRFGWGRGASCSGCGCGLILFILFIMLASSIIFSTDWFRIGF